MARFNAMAGLKRREPNGQYSRRKAEQERTDTKPATAKPEPKAQRSTTAKIVEFHPQATLDAIDAMATLPYSECRVGTPAKAIDIGKASKSLDWIEWKAGKICRHVLDARKKAGNHARPAKPSQSKYTPCSEPLTTPTDSQPDRQSYQAALIDECRGDELRNATGCYQTWNERLNGIADHLETGKPLRSEWKQWSDDLETLFAEVKASENGLAAVLVSIEAEKRGLYIEPQDFPNGITADNIGFSVEVAERLNRLDHGKATEFIAAKTSAAITAATARCQEIVQT